MKKAQRIEELKELAAERAEASEMMYGQSRTELWANVKFFALRRHVSDAKLTLHNLDAIRAYIEVSYDVPEVSQ